MKTKILALALALVLFLAACGTPPAETTTPPTTTPIETTAPLETTAPAPVLACPLSSDNTYWDLAQELPDHIYTTTGSENGLGGTVYQFEGVVKSRDSIDADVFTFERAVVETAGGDLVLTNYYKGFFNAMVDEVGADAAAAMFPESVSNYEFPEVGERAMFLTIYGGFSGTMNMPSFYLGANSMLFEILELPDPAAVPKPTEAGEAADVTMGEKNALGTALSYLSYSAFSYTGLIDQLEYEGYTTEEATYAADNCGADWMEQALQSALSYLDFSAFSHSGLIDQLEYEGFTTEEATYAADNCGADWMEQAAKCAKSYLEFSSYSRSRLIEQLEYEGFTHEQAVYGADQNGY